MTGRFRNYILLAIVVIMLLIIGSCNGTQESTQIIEHITAQEGFDLIQDNLDNQDFVIIDVRTPEEFAIGYIEDAINIDFYSNTFRDEIDKLDKNKTYLIYCQSGVRSESALEVMKDLNFREVYNMLGGISAYVGDISGPTIKSVTAREAFNLMQDNPDFVIIDVRGPELFSQEHIQNAINMDFYSKTFLNDIDDLNRSKVYFLYCDCGKGGMSELAAGMMAELGFQKAYDISDGFSGWKAEGFPTVK